MSFIVRYLAIFAFLLVLARGFYFPSTQNSKKPTFKMMFGGGAKKKDVTITVDGKVISCPEPTNLRKALLANKIDVYPLKAKLTGKINTIHQSNYFHSVDFSNI